MTSILPIVFTCDTRYIPYTATAIQSLISKSRTPGVFYKIYLMSNDLTDDDKNFLLKLVAELRNSQVSLEFIKLSNLTNVFAKTQSYISISTYFRIVLPLVFSQYDYLLYLDCDTVCGVDPWQFTQYLSKIDQVPFIGIVDKWMKHCLEVVCIFEKDDDYQGQAKRTSPYSQHLQRNFYSNKELNWHYFAHTLGMDYLCEYFNAGVLLFNLKYLREMKQEYAPLLASKVLTNPIYSDQCYLNFVNKKLSKKARLPFLAEWCNRNIHGPELIAHDSTWEQAGELTNEYQKEVYTEMIYSDPVKLTESFAKTSRTSFTKALPPLDLRGSETLRNAREAERNAAKAAKNAIESAQNATESPKNATEAEQNVRESASSSDLNLNLNLNLNFNSHNILRSANPLKDFQAEKQSQPQLPLFLKPQVLFHYISGDKPWKRLSLETITWWAALKLAPNTLWYINNHTKYTHHLEKGLDMFADVFFDDPKPFIAKYGYKEYYKFHKEFLAKWSQIYYDDYRVSQANNTGRAVIAQDCKESLEFWSRVFPSLVNSEMIKEFTGGASQKQQPSSSEQTQQTQQTQQTKSTQQTQQTQPTQSTESAQSTESTEQASTDDYLTNYTRTFLHNNLFTLEDLESDPDYQHYRSKTGMFNERHIF